MTRLFGRTYNLEVTSAEGNKLTCEPPTQVKFLITNMPENQVATAMIMIYGVSDQYRQLIQKFDETRQRFGTVRLTAGYEESSGEVFTGQINSVEVGRDGVNVYLRLNCWTEVWSDATIGKTWGEKTRAIEILQDVARSFGPPIETVGDFSDLPMFNHGYTLPHTSSRNFLNAMKSAWRYNWLLSDTKITLIRDGATRPTTYELNSDNGMESSPRWYKKDMEVDARLNHIIQPGDLIKIRSDFWTINYSGMYNTGLNDMSNIQRRTGSFRVLSTTHQGDFWNDDWRTTFRCQWSAA
ncbi:phage protein [Pectobacterium carotovorum]